MVLPPDGSYRITHEVRIFEATDPPTLESAINAGKVALQNDSTAYWYIQSVEYSSAQIANNMVSYSALIHGVKAEII